MSSSTTNLDLISSSQAQKEVTANTLFDSASPATFGARRASTSSGLTWGFYGGRFAGNTVANGTLTLTNSATNYIEVNASAGTVSSNTAGFTVGRTPLYSVVCSGGIVTSYIDYRESIAAGLPTVSTITQTSEIVASPKTVFTIAAYPLGLNAVAVYRNGKRLTKDDDFTETNGTTITLATAADAGDAMLFFSGTPMASFGTMATQNASSVAITGGSITGITDLAVADGGTGASTASAARTNLGLAIGTDVQAQDAELQAIAGLVSAADRLPYFTGSGAAALATFTAAGRAIVDDADAAAQRTTLGLGTIATQNAASVDIDGGTIDGTVIGGSSAAAGSFTTINANGAVSFDGAFFSDGAPANSIYVAGNGFVGIGTSGPIHFVDAVKDQNDVTSFRVRNNDSGSSAYSQIIYNAFGNSWGIRMGSMAANSNALELVLDTGSPVIKFKLDTTGNAYLTAVGSGYRTKEGSNAKQGTATLVAGTVTVSNTSVTTSSRIFLTAQAPGGTVGAVYVSARNAGTDFTITSTSALDTSTIAYEIFEPA